MPRIFKSKDEFQGWFEFGQYDGAGRKDEKMKMVQALHKILKPFMLRRTKAELAKKLPEKIEINVEVQLTPLQVEVY